MSNGNIIVNGSSNSYYYNGIDLIIIDESRTDLFSGFYVNELKCTVDAASHVNFSFNPDNIQMARMSVNVLGDYSTASNNYLSLVQFLIENDVNIDNRLTEDSYNYNYSYISDNTNQLLLNYTTNNGSYKNYIITICYDDVKKWIKYAYKAKYDMDIEL